MARLGERGQKDRMGRMTDVYFYTTLPLIVRQLGGVPRSGEGVDKLFVCVVSLSYQFLSTPSVTSFLVPLSQWDSLLARYSINFQSQANSN